MDKKNTNIEWRVLRKATSNQLDEHEQFLFEKWLNANKRNQIYFTKAKRYYQEIDGDEKEIDYLNAFAQFEKEIKRKSWKPAIHIAASIVIILCVSWFTYFVVNLETYQKLSEADLIKPYSGEVELILSSGETVVLDHEEEKRIQIAGGDIKSYSGSVDYLNVEAVPQQIIEYNTIIVPKGTNFKITLSDSTVVWLNTESSITYPVKFIGDSRQVAITGEVYFDVSHNKEKPFIVNVEGTKVEVLGTEFNVKAYADQERVYTTLVEGSVAVGNQFGKSALIKPKEQAITGNSANVEVKQVDLDQVLGWRIGKFVFEDEPLENILTELSRWYDFKVFFESEDLKKHEFTGSLGHFKDVNQLLLLFEKTRAVEFKVNENVLLVKKPDNK